jgi:tetratricopeptide (TPR) repeat protein
MAKNWTEEEEEHIRQNFLTHTYGDLAEHFGVTTKAMESKIRRMGLKKQEMLADAADAPELAPEPEHHASRTPEVQSTSPIERIQTLQRRIEVHEETDEERSERLELTRKAAEAERARREEARSQAPVADALKKFTSGYTKLLEGKHAQAAKDFQAILDAPPNDLGLVMRARQYLAATEVGNDSAPDPKTAEDMYNHGIVLMNDGELQSALEMFDAAAKKTPGDDRITYVRAVALALSGEEDASLEMLAAAIEANDVNRVYARNDPDFGDLSGNAAFRALTAPLDEDAKEEA